MVVATAGEVGTKAGQKRPATLPLRVLSGYAVIQALSTFRSGKLG